MLHYVGKTFVKTSHSLNKQLVSIHKCQVIVEKQKVCCSTLKLIYFAESLIFLKTRNGEQRGISGNSSGSIYEFSCA